MNRPYRFGDVVEWDAVPTRARWFIIEGQHGAYGAMSLMETTRESYRLGAMCGAIGASGDDDEALLTPDEIMSTPHTRPA